MQYGIIGLNKLHDEKREHYCATSVAFKAEILFLTEVWLETAKLASRIKDKRKRVENYSLDII